MILSDSIDDRLRMVAKGVKADTVMHLGLDLTESCRCWVVCCCGVRCLPSGEHLVVRSADDPMGQRYNTILDGAVRASRFALCDQFLGMSSGNEASWKHMKAYESLQFRFQHGRTQADSGNITVWHRCLQLYSFDHGEDTWSFMEIQEATNCSRVR